MSTNSLYGFVTADGQQLAAPIYEDARSFSDGVAPVKIRGKWGYIDKFLEFEIPPQFDLALPFSEGLARVEKDGSWGYINHKGIQVTLKRTRTRERRMDGWSWCLWASLENKFRPLRCYIGSLGLRPNEYSNNLGPIGSKTSSSEFNSLPQLTVTGVESRDLRQNATSTG